ncbi:MAG: GNAT family N-acetyltransferase [Candidatus Dormibacteria bacterium]
MTAPRLFQGRLVRLTAPRPEDAATLSRWSEDGEYRRFADTDAPRPLPAQYYAERDQAGEEPPADAYEFRVRTLEEDRLVGFIAIVSIEWPNRHGWLALGIGDPGDRRRGYGREASQLALRFGFHELGLHRLSLDVIADNQPAIALYRSLGFAEEGRLRERVHRDGRFSDLVHMGLLSRDWETARTVEAAG